MNETATSDELSTENSDSSEYDSDRNEDDRKNNGERFKNRLLKVLKNVTGSTEFAISGFLSDAPTQLISINKNQKIMRFPTFEEDLPSIIGAFKQSPYGKGEETIVDVSFRNSWHLDANDFVIMNPKWNQYVNDVLIPRIKSEMAITTSFEASLYKLLLYKGGSFFKPHRDTEKEERMFGTLVIQLPSHFNGGQLVIEHDKQTKTIDFSSNADAGNEFGTFFSAFYCDCKHEILPITDGIRICLVYNLVMNEAASESSLVPTAPVSFHIETEMTSLCNEWLKTGNPTKIVYGLSHKYTERGLSYQSLKSTDKMVAAALVKWSKEHSFVVFLGTLEKTWEGDETFLDDNLNDDDVEVTYSLEHLEIIGSPDNVTLPKCETLSVDCNHEMIPKHCFRNVQPFDRQREETGNEGTILTLTYRHSVLVIIPVENFFNILVDEGKYDEAKSVFFDAFKKFERNDEQNDVAKKKIVKYGHKLIRDSKCERISVEMFPAVKALNDLSLVQICFENYTLNAESIDSIVEQCEKFGWTALSQHLLKSLKKLNREKALQILDLIVGHAHDSTGGEGKKDFFLSAMELISTRGTQDGRLTADFLRAFVTLAKKYQSDGDGMNTKLIGWCHNLISFSPWSWQRDAEMTSVEIISTLTTLDDLPLLQKYLENRVLNIESIESIVKQCEKFGWAALSQQLLLSFKKLERVKALEILDVCVGNPVDFVGKEEKKIFCFSLMELIPTLRYTNSQQGTEDFLYAFCILAKRINYDPCKHLKLQSFDVIVPVFVKLASMTESILDRFWTEAAQHFLTAMETIDRSANQTPVWIRNYFGSCGCEDCAELSRFMKTDTKSKTFRIIQKRRLHLERIIKGVNYLSFTTDSTTRPATMVVSKNVPSSYTSSQQQSNARKLLPKLTAIFR